MEVSKVVVVTGGAGGIGSAICMEMARRGWQIAIVDYNKEAGAAAKEKISQIGQAEYFWCNLNDMRSIEQAVGEIAAHFGRIDGLVNAAATTDHHRVSEIDSTLWDQYMNLNLKAQFFMARHCAKYMSATGGGRIVNISSALGYMADGRHILYGASKIGICSMTRNLAVDLWKDNIQVNSLLPCYVITPLVAQHLNEPGWLEAQLERILSNRMATPEDMAAVAAFLLTCKTPFLNGQEIMANSGYLEFIRKMPANA